MQILFNELKNYKISLLLILVLTYISTTFELIIPLLLANALNIGIIQNYGLRYIKEITAMMLFFIIISIILNYIISYLISRISIYSSHNIKNNIFSKILMLNPKEKEKYALSTLINRTTQDTEQIKNFIFSLLSIIFKAPILFISCITIIKTLNNKFSSILIISIIILVVYIIIVTLKLLPLSQKIQPIIDRLNTLIKEKISGFKIIKTYNKLKYQDQKFINENKKHLNTSKKIIKTSASTYPILNLIINSLTIIILLISIKLVKSNALEIGNIVATIQYILQILLSIIMLSTIIILIPKTSVATSRIKEIMNLQSFKNLEKDSKLDINTICFKNISFSYNNANLKNINLTINKKEKIGIIGPTGSGKSTLIKLLFKENELQEGNIYINDLSLNDLTRKDITYNITYLPQISTILTGTILENITFANQTVSLEEISKIIHTCNLEQFIMKKEEKLNYKLEENGSNLSGGQKQRICLARALAKNDDIIILDDPFSSIDYKTEKEIINKLKTYYEEKTLIIISQKISSLKDLDKIIVMDKGEIIAIDTHENLLKNCKLYQDMYNYQKEVIEYDI